MFKVNKWLVGGVVVVAAIAVGLYVYRFWGKPLSTDPGDWADFATYLSGTVGVAAVVATLLAFVKTLGQQQALIDSQDRMISEQEKQIAIANEQLENEERRRSVELAHSRAKNIFPTLAEHCGLRVHKSFYPDGLFMRMCYESGGYSNSLHSNEIFCFPGNMIEKIEEVDDFEILYKDIDILMEDVASISDLMLECLKVSPDLYIYFDTLLCVEGSNYWMYIKKYHSYLLGCGFEEKCCEMSRLFRFGEKLNLNDRVAKDWEKVGELISQSR